MAVLGGIPIDLAEHVVDAFLEWRAGPHTPESEALESQASDLREQARTLRLRADALETQAFTARLKAKRARPTWLNKNRDALLVNVVAGLIVGVPTFALGVLVTIVLQ